MKLTDKIYGYGKQNLGEEDYEGILNCLKSDFLTQGPAVSRFEEEVASYTSAKYCVAVANGTAALHIAALALNLEPKDEIITSPNTFLASANCILYANAKPVFADIDPETANIDPAQIEKGITTNTKAIIPVHFAGQSCDMKAIADIAKKHNLKIIEDAAHAIGSDYNGNKVGSCKYSDMTIFSFHPVKTITTGEGGAITTNDKTLYNKLCALRNHGMHRDGELIGTWKYEMRELGFNYRMTDIQATLGLTQLTKLEDFKKRRREIVEYYNRELCIEHLIEQNYSNACFHLYPILIEKRDQFYFKAKEVGLNLQIHYIPVHTQPYYQQFGYKYGEYPICEEYYNKTISLPLYPSLTDADLNEIVKRVKGIISCTS